MLETESYYHIVRDDWKLYQKDYPLHLSQEELAHITSLNDRMSLQDVQEIYIPMMDYFDIYYQKHQDLHQAEQIFLKQAPHTIPFIIGVSGSVAVGKSTTARLLQHLLQQIYPDKQIDLMTTDGFLYSTKDLIAKNLLNRKGFPESYDMPALIQFLLDIKTGREASAPVYSHDIYDIVPDTFQTIQGTDILIVEGINVLQLPPNHEIYVSDFFDWSIYVDADSDLIEKWYLERFELLMDRAKNQPHNYYYKYAIGKREDALKMAKDVWKTINLKNLEEYILPTRSRADFIIHKTENHHIDFVQLKRY